MCVCGGCVGGWAGGGGGGGGGGGTLRTLRNTFLTRPTVSKDKVSTIPGLNNAKRISVAATVLGCLVLGEREGVRLGVRARGLEPGWRYIQNSRHKH